MKTHITRSRHPARQTGAALPVGLMTVTVLGVIIVGHLELTLQQHRAMERSASWNECIPALEAGAEEALLYINHLHQSNLLTTNGNWAGEGWTAGAGSISKTRNISDGMSFSTVISNSVPPTVITTGEVKTGLFGKPALRTVQITTRTDYLFTKAIAANEDIDLNGRNVKTDSYISDDPSASTDGQYDPAKARDNGDVATNSSLIDALDVGVATITGRVSTGPSGEVDVGRIGSVGSSTWVASGSTGIEAGYSSDDMNIYFPDVKEPFTGGYSAPVGTTLGGTNYLYALSSGNYRVTEISTSDPILVTGHATLLIDGNLRISGGGGFIIEPGASLKVYVAGSTTSLSGRSVSNPGLPEQFQYYGLPTNTSFSMTGNAQFNGTIYAPSAHIRLGGGGSDDLDFCGAMIGNSVTMNGTMEVHYDEALGRKGPIRGYIANSWEEI